MDQFRIIFPPIPQKYKAMYKNEGCRCVCLGVG